MDGRMFDGLITFLVGAGILVGLGIAGCVWLFSTYGAPFLHKVICQ